MALNEVDKHKLLEEIGELQHQVREALPSVANCTLEAAIQALQREQPKVTSAIEAIKAAVRAGAGIGTQEGYLDRLREVQKVLQEEQSEEG